MRRQSTRRRFVVEWRDKNKEPEKKGFVQNRWLLIRATASQSSCLTTGYRVRECGVRGYVMFQ